jgi:hypothetical protein
MKYFTQPVLVKLLNLEKPDMALYNCQFCKVKRETF